MRSHAASSCFVTALALTGVAAPSAAADLEVTASVTFTTDYVFRGVSQTREEPALQAALGVEHPSGWFGGVFASTVDFPPPPSGQLQDPRDVELDLHLGYGRELGRGWAVVGNAVRYEYPGRDRGHDYNEVGLGLEYRGVRASVAYTDEALGFAGSGMEWEVNARRRLPLGLGLSAGVGWYELARLEDGYAFWHAALVRSFGRFAADLGYYGSDDNGRRLWAERAEGRLVLAVSYRIR